MKNYLLTGFALLFIFQSGLLFSAEDPRAEDRKELLSYLTIIEQALNGGGIENIVPLLREDVVVTFINAEVSRGIPAVLEYHGKVLGSSNALLSSYTTKAKVSKPARFFGDIALVDGTTVDTYSFPTGDVVEMDAVWSVTLFKEDNVWKIAQLNFSANPFSNPILAGIESRIVTFSVVGLIVGLVIGLLIGRLRKKSA